MKKLWVQPQGEGRYLVGAGKIRRDVLATDKRDALRRAKATLSAADRAAIATATKRSERV